MPQVFDQSLFLFQLVLNASANFAYYCFSGREFRSRFCHGVLRCQSSRDYYGGGGGSSIGGMMGGGMNGHFAAATVSTVVSTTAFPIAASSSSSSELGRRRSSRLSGFRERSATEP